MTAPITTTGRSQWTRQSNMDMSVRRSGHGPILPMEEAGSDWPVIGKAVFYFAVMAGALGCLVALAWWLG